MNSNTLSTRSCGRRRQWCAALVALVACAPAHASFLSGETLDSAAEFMAWVVLIVAPIVGIVVFLLIHILPEKIAEKKRHPQTALIQTLCILSLFFGGLLWPLAWLLAYSKPVLYKMAYGTDVVEPKGEAKAQATEPVQEQSKSLPVSAQIAAMEADKARREQEAEVERLRAELGALRRQLDARSGGAEA
jgi:CBS domain containing-hemolysin-like protein